MNTVESPLTGTHTTGTVKQLAKKRKKEYCIYPRGCQLTESALHLFGICLSPWILIN